MGKLALKIWENQYETIKKIPKKSQREKIALAILDYAFTGTHDKLEYPLDVIMQSMYIGLTLKNQGGAPVGNKNNRHSTVVQPLYNPCTNVDTTLEQPLLENKKEENINKKEESINKKKEKEYYFKGKVIKLNQKDFDNWKKAYPDLNLWGELLLRDKWLAEQPPEKVKDWFLSTSKYFLKRNEICKRQNAELDEEKHEYSSIGDWDTTLTAGEVGDF